MDALALLCTLHADGPATLQRLRARGYGSLQALTAESPDALSEHLKVEPAAARRFLREAKLLAVRVGAEGLEPEEAPPGHSAAPPRVPFELGSATGGPGAPKRGDVEGATAPASGAAEAAADSPAADPAVGQPGELDATDHSLLEQILAQGSPSVTAETVAEAPPGEAPPAEAPPAEASGEPAPEAFADTEEDTGIPDPEPAASFEEGSLVAGCLPGLEADLVADLSAMGVTTLEGLAKAQSLQLTRALGVTFAQARRLGFLARRAALELDRPGLERHRPNHSVAARSTAGLSAPIAPLGAAHGEVPAVKSEHIPETEPEIQFEAHEAVEVEAEGPAPSKSAVEAEEAPPAPQERQPFWTPRAFLSPKEDAPAESVPQQGVKVDPSEIAPRPRFGDRLARAAKERADAQAQQRAEGGSDLAPAEGHTILGWNFEIPRPVAEPALPLGSVAVPLEPSASEAEPAQVIEREPSTPDSDTSGPFA